MASIEGVESSASSLHPHNRAHGDHDREHNNDHGADGHTRGEDASELNVPNPELGTELKLVESIVLVEGAQADEQPDSSRAAPKTPKYDINDTIAALEQAGFSGYEIGRSIPFKLPGTCWPCLLAYGAKGAPRFQDDAEADEHAKTHIGGSWGSDGNFNCATHSERSPEDISKCATIAISIRPDKERGITPAYCRLCDSTKFVKIW
ncbi:hypothetical protein M408DRAFT_317601 [Serendipita vermifera MAFF 305830]|uniref:Uncharacterized protein n=1 Tax=Serendipita vermifera MAFF 305830 TaxID=933852 RepID=A0A0C3AI97_SERVB|nr:hypothetical protein M408DRAFT_317601 [Serendipita vermifera MAFF 305830]